eukprot:Opistho-1_new@12651
MTRRHRRRECEIVAGVEVARVLALLLLEAQHLVVDAALLPLLLRDAVEELGRTEGADPRRHKLVHKGVVLGGLAINDATAAHVHIARQERHAAAQPCCKPQKFLNHKLPLDAVAFGRPVVAEIVLKVVTTDTIYACELEHLFHRREARPQHGHAGHDHHVLYAVPRPRGLKRPPRRIPRVHRHHVTQGTLSAQVQIHNGHAPTAEYARIVVAEHRTPCLHRAAGRALVAVREKVAGAWKLLLYFVVLHKDLPRSSARRNLQLKILEEIACHAENALEHGRRLHRGGVRAPPVEYVVVVPHAQHRQRRKRRAHRRVGPPPAVEIKEEEGELVAHCGREGRRPLLLRLLLVLFVRQRHPGPQQTQSPQRVRVHLVAAHEEHVRVVLLALRREVLPQRVLRGEVPVQPRQARGRRNAVARGVRHGGTRVHRRRVDLKRATVGSLVRDVRARALQLRLNRVVNNAPSEQFDGAVRGIGHAIKDDGAACEGRVGLVHEHDRIVPLVARHPHNRDARAQQRALWKRVLVGKGIAGVHVQTHARAAVVPHPVVSRGSPRAVVVAKVHEPHVVPHVLCVDT